MAAKNLIESIGSGFRSELRAGEETLRTSSYSTTFCVVYLM